jgi:hypothetical protein
MPKQRKKASRPFAASTFTKKTRRRKRTGTKIKPVATGYFNDTDPYRSYTTKQQARTEGVRLSAITKKKRSARVPTFYTILQDRRKGVPAKKFSGKLQGPHTIPHYYILDALVNARADSILEEIADLRLTPKEFEEIVNKEIPVGHKKRARAEVAIQRYDNIYNKGDSLFKITKPSEADQVRLVHTLNKALQMHPYQTYSYKGTGAGAAALGGKGERRGTQLTIDLPGTAGFKNNDAVRKVLKKLAKSYGTFQRTDAVG